MRWLLLLPLLFIGCDTGPGRGKVNMLSDQKDDDLAFIFEMGIGSGLYGFNTLQVDGSLNKARFRFSGSWEDPGTATAPWEVLEFQVPEATLAKLKSLLVQMDFLNSQDVYTSSIADGTQKYVSFHSKTESKRVWCDNNFPEHIETLITFALESIVKPAVETLGASRSSS